MPMCVVVDSPGLSRHLGDGGRSLGGALMDEKVTTLSSLGDLIGAVQRGSQAALRRLYDLESRRLYGIALRIVRRPEMAADAVQEAFVQIWQNADKYAAERGDVAAWLTGIVRYRALDAARKLNREVLTDDPELGDRPDEPDIAELIDRKVENAALRRCLDRLDENQRRCIVLAFVDGFSHADIAARLPAPLGSVKSWVRRGLIALRSCLEP